MYTGGDGVAKDENKAAFWYEQAAMQEYADAQAMLAVMYFEGAGVPKDVEKTKYWMRKAIEHGDTEAMEFWGWLDLGEYEPTRLAGSFRKGVYAAPNKLFRAKYRLTGGTKNDPCCEETVIDSFDEQRGKGTVSLSNEYGALNGVIYGPASLVGADADLDSAQILKRWFHAEVMALLHSIKPQARLLHEERRLFNTMDAWIAVVDIPGGAVAGKYAISTGRYDPADSVRGFVVFQRGTYVFTLMCETNVLSFFGESRVYDPDRWDDFLAELSAFYSTTRFEKS
jgi:hypothetical protein